MRREYTRIVRKRKGGKVYYFRYWEGNSQVERSTGKSTVAEAEKFIKDFLKIKKDEESKKAAKRQVTFEEFTKDFFKWDSCKWIKEQITFKRKISEPWANQKRKLLENHLLPVFKKRLLSEITKAEIRTFLVNLPGKEQIKNHVLYCIKQIFQQAEDEELIESSKAASLRGFSVDRGDRGTFTDEERIKLFPPNRMLDVWRDNKRASMFLILDSTGIRSGELRAIFWEDFDGESIFIHRGVKDDRGTIGETKTGIDRFVYPSPLTLKYLKQYAKETQDKEGIMFPGENGKPYIRRSLFLMIDHAFKQSGVKKENRTVHSFRHGYNTRLLTAGVSPENIRLLMGHKTERMTSHYDKPSIDNLRERARQAKQEIDNKINDVKK